MLQKVPKIDLRALILLFTVVSVLATLANSLAVAYQVYREILVRNALVTNEAYARKISMSVSHTLESDITTLRYSANVVAADMGRVYDEMHRLLGQDANFNSIVVADANGQVTATLPENPKLIGKQLRSWSPDLNDAPRTSPAFRSLSGNLVVYISYPVRNAAGDALGVIGGTIHLTSDNPLHDIIGNHGYRNGAFIYLIDGAGTYLFHPDPNLLGQQAGADDATRALLRGETGSQVTLDAGGNEAMSGYATIPDTSWGVVSAQPLTIADVMVKELVRAMAWRMLPLVVLGLLLIGWGAWRISRPLRQLADAATRLGEHSGTSLIAGVQAWYVEAWRIRRALLAGMGSVEDRLDSLSEQANGDALTGLANRRAMDQAIARYVRERTPFAAIAADIDHFKRVNDTFGHDVGDHVLGRIAGLLRASAREYDLVCRVGGEEFLVLLPNAPLQVAAAIAERIRAAVEADEMEQACKVTLSLGVSLWREDDGLEPAQALKRADELLYAAKQAGRNRVMVEAAVVQA